VADNILQKSLAVTYEEFLKGVFGKKKKPEWKALMTLFSEIVTGNSTLVSELSKPLRENSSSAECKRVQERVSGWLANYDFVEATGGWLLKNIPETGLDRKTFAIDHSDISKVFGGEGMEGMAMGRDGSTGEIRMGHDFVCVSLVGADYPEVLDSLGMMAVCAERAAQAYCDRWQIETSFYVMKQEFALEKVRVRTFKRLENIFSLCVLAYCYVTQCLRKSKGF